MLGQPPCFPLFLAFLCQLPLPRCAGVHTCVCPVAQTWCCNPGNLQACRCSNLFLLCRCVLCMLHLVPGLGTGRVQTLSQLSAMGLLKGKQTCCTAGCTARCSWGYTVLREVVGVSLPQGFPAGTLSAKTMLFFRLESDVSLLKGRASVLGRFSARWYGMSSPLLQCATGISVLL